MKNVIAQRVSLVLAAMAPMAAVTAVATPVAAQATTMSSQAMAEGLLAALNGRMSDRNAWARENLLRDNLYSSRMEQLRTIARRTNELTLVNVQDVESGFFIDVRDGRGRSSRIVVQTDDAQPGKVRGLSLNRP